MSVMPDIAVHADRALTDFISADVIHYVGSIGQYMLVSSRSWATTG